jgi:FKBP-type peptidyl-prolyl cis-trans isomerase
MNKKIVVVVGSAVFLVLACGGVWYWQRNKAQESQVAADGSPVLLEMNRQDQTKGIPLDAEPNERADDNPLKVTQAQDYGQTNFGAGNTGSNGGAAAGRMPSPDSFETYEKYKTAESAMYADIVKGTGSEVVIGKKLAVSYKGWLTNGELFDRSKEGSPFVFTMGEHRVIPGWEQGLSGMKTGGRRMLIIPPAVGYGAEGKAPIPPNAVLIFEVELLEVEK